MTNSDHPNTPSEWDSTGPRVIVACVAAANALFWIWTFSYIAVHSNPKGDGFEWISALPFAAIFLGLIMPAMLSAVRGKGLGRALIFVMAATMLNAIIFLAVMGSTVTPR